MKCYVCLMEVAVSKEIVGLCTACGVALCGGHFMEAGRTRHGGMRYTCSHSFPTPAQVARTEAAPGGAASQHVAACKHCGIALTLAGVAELATHAQGGMRYGCPHTARAQVPA
ncbi:MAG: DUF2180 family protein [Candidatus Rokubacteria bacterium]|nr:DUF2180 family protein [Candidatus Rokubacteria bacterium]